MKYLIYIMLFLGLISIVAATDKQLTSIPYCFNVSIYYELLDGNYTPVAFKDCSILAPNYWVCDCHNYVGIYNVTMQSDGTFYYPSRIYKIIVNYTTYNLDSYNDELTVQDYGTNTEVNGEVIDMGKSYYTLTQVYYMNNTVYEDRVINNTYYVNVTQYYENYTTIDAYAYQLYITNDSLNNITKVLNTTDNQLKTSISNGKNKDNKIFWLWTTMIIIILIVVGGVLYLWNQD